jgi:hypothetical protein
MLGVTRGWIKKHFMPIDKDLTPPHDSIGNIALQKTCSNLVEITATATPTDFDYVLIPAGYYICATVSATGSDDGDIEFNNGVSWISHGITGAVYGTTLIPMILSDGSNIRIVGKVPLATITFNARRLDD